MAQLGQVCHFRLNSIFLGWILEIISTVISVRFDNIIIMIKLNDYYSHDTQIKYISLAMSFEKLCSAFASHNFLQKLIAWPISLCIILNPFNFISNLVYWYGNLICSCSQRSQIKVKGYLRSHCKINLQMKFGLICILED